MEWKELRQHHDEIVKRLWLCITVNTLVLVLMFHDAVKRRPKLVSAPPPSNSCLFSESASFSVFNHKGHTKLEKAYLITGETLDYTPPASKKYVAPKML